MVEHATARTVYLSPMTTLDRVLDDLRALPPGSVTLVLDPLSVVFSIPDHYRALDAVRLARSLTITFVVDDAHRTGLALAFGYHIRPRGTERHEERSVQPQKTPLLHTSQLATGPPVGRREPIRIAEPAPQDAPMTRSAPRPTLAAVAQGGDTSSARWPRRRERGFVWVCASLAMLLVVLCAVVVYLEAAVHTAAIVLHPAEQTFSRVITVAISDGPTDDPNAIQATTFETTLSRELDVPATGQITVPDGTATGTMTLRSRADGATTIKAGTVLRGPKDVAYIVQTDVTVPGLDFVRGQLGEAKVQVKASAAGPAGNLSAGFSNRYTENLTYISGEITGGTLKQVAAVTDDDIAAARTQLESEIRRHALADVNAALPGGTTALNDNLVLRTPSVGAQPPAGTQAERVHVKVTIAAQIPVYRNADFDAFITRKLDDVVRELDGQGAGAERVVPESVMKSKPVFVDTQGSLVRYFATVTGTMRSVITDADSARLRDAIVGKDRPAVARVLAAEKKIGSYDIRFGPRWLPAVMGERMPRNRAHIQVRVQ